MRTTRYLLTGVVLGTAAFLSGCGEQEPADDIINPPRPAEVAALVSAEEAISGANVPTLDPAPMNDAEVAKVLGQPAQCTFRYTSFGKPVLALQGAPGSSEARAVLKVNGDLVELKPLGDGRLSSGPITVTLSPAEEAPGEMVEAGMFFEIGESLGVGYQGYHQCGG